MACVDGLAPYVVRVLAPDRLYVVDPLHDATPTPERQERTFHLAAFVQVRFVVDEVDGGCGPVVFAAGVDHGGLETAFVLCQGLWRERLQARAPAAELLAQVVRGFSPDQGLRKVVGLDIEEPVIVGRRQVLAHRSEDVAGGHYIENGELRDAVRVVERHPVPDPSSPIVPDDGEGVGQYGGDQVPHRVSLWIAVEEQDRGSITRVDQLYLGARGLYPLPLEAR